EPGGTGLGGGSASSPLQCHLKLGSTSAALEPPSFAWRKTLGCMLGDPSQRALTDPVVDQDFLQRVLSPNSSSQPAGLGVDVSSLGLIYSLIVFSEMWEQPTPDEDIMRKRYADTRICSGGFYVSLQCRPMETSLSYSRVSSRSLLSLR
ncbi:TPA: hypothetical protein N0F65_000810, partial [Lagenidium giganteum]